MVVVASNPRSLDFGEVTCDTKGTRLEKKRQSVDLTDKLVSGIDDEQEING